MKKLLNLFFFSFLFLPSFSLAFTLSPQYLQTPTYNSTTASEPPSLGQFFVFQSSTGAWCGNTSDENFSSGLIVGSCFGDTQNLYVVSVQNPGDGYGDCAVDFSLCLLDSTHYVSSQGWTTLFYGFPSVPVLTAFGTSTATIEIVKFSEYVALIIGGSIGLILGLLAALIGLYWGISKTAKSIGVWIHDSNYDDNFDDDLGNRYTEKKAFGKIMRSYDGDYWMDESDWEIERSKRLLASNKKLMR